MHGVVVLDVDQLVERFLDENEGDETGEVLLCEPGDVANEGASVCRDQNHKYQTHPHARTEPEGEVRPTKRPEMDMRKFNYVMTDSLCRPLGCNVQGYNS